ncbi:hypothetical protein [Tenacibaculum mesophilum]|uniref:hypothetical protein n=1 Tax=Tenacibaculum mesophilum TaxID=104268 RepID=UPI00069E5418|nr:hypothetical protein [Tenacibaculum mesophilum]
MSKHHQPFKILTQPTLVNKEQVYPNKGVLIKKANDEFYIYDLESSLFTSKVFGAIAVACGIWFLNNDGLEISDIIFSTSIILIGLFFFIYGLTANKKKKMLILDRLNGTVTYPDLFYLPPLKGKFKDLKAVISVSGDIDGAPGREYLKFVNTFKPRKLDVLRTITYDNPYEEWSLYVWYMDKNRPLPPGTAFDPYRQQDFERRKALGFPRPLYKSTIPTHEFTKEQQAERKRIGGW